MTTEHSKSSYRCTAYPVQGPALLAKVHEVQDGQASGHDCAHPEVPQGGNDIEQCCLFCPSSCMNYLFNLLYLLYLNLRTQISTLQRAGRGAS